MNSSDFRKQHILPAQNLAVVIKEILTVSWSVTVQSKELWLVCISSVQFCRSLHKISFYLYVVVINVHH